MYCGEGNCSGNVSHGWATHGADVAYIEGGSISYTKTGTERGVVHLGWGQKVCNQTVEEVRLSDRMQEYWASFAKTGRPSAPRSEGATWPAFDEGEGEGCAMQLDTGEWGGLREDFKAKQCDFWDQIAPLGPHLAHVDE